MSLASAPQQQPAKPKLRLWGTVSGWISFGLYAIAKSGYEFSTAESLTLAALPAIPLLVALFILYKENRHYEVAPLEWKIRSQRDWIVYHERQLAEGQPWFDDDDPDEWTFEHKRSIANTKDRLAELEVELEQLQSLHRTKGVA